MNLPDKSQYEILRHYKQITFFNQCYARFLEARNQKSEVKLFCNIAGSAVCLSFAGSEMVNQIFPALQHLQIPAVENPELTICIWDSASTAVEMVPPPCTLASFTDRGDLWGFNSNRIKTAFHWIENSVQVMDIQKKTAVFWVRSSKQLPFWVTASPLRTIIHWWMEQKGYQLLHASVVGNRHGAVLITGKGGVGKSTTALACLNDGMFYLADDYIVVGFDPDPVAFCLYSTAKLNSEDVSKFPLLSEYINNPEKLNAEKAVMFLYPHLKDQILDRISLKAIFLPSVRPRPETRIVGENYWKIQRAMAFTTMSQLPNVGLHTHAIISKLANALPGFTLELGFDLKGIPEVVNDFLNHPDKFRPSEEGEQSMVPEVKHRPLISVIMPVYNGEQFIEEAIQNILSQNYPALEIIIVDDGSTDNSVQIIEQLPVDIRFFSQPNEGPGSARNRGIKDVSGEYIAFLDVDDLWPENNLNLLADELLNDTGLELVRGHAQLLELDAKSGEYKFIGEPRHSFPNYIGAALYRRSAFDKVGLYDVSLKYGEDTDWFLRAIEKKLNMKRIEEVTLYVRRHGNNMTEGKNLLELNKLRVFKKALDRLRSDEGEGVVKQIWPS